MRHLSSFSLCHRTHVILLQLVVVWHDAHEERTPDVMHGDGDVGFLQIHRVHARCTSE